MRDDREKIRDILEAIERVEKYSARGRQAFEGDELIQIWIVHHLQIIGEAARALSAEFTGAHSQVPWSQLVGMRNVLVHHYFGVDTDIVWEAVKRDLPSLKAQLETILAS
jgi:uncharacterized protein with HEPN domain